MLALHDTIAIVDDKKILKRLIGVLCQRETDEDDLKGCCGTSAFSWSYIELR